MDISVLRHCRVNLSRPCVYAIFQVEHSALVARFTKSIYRKNTALALLADKYRVNGGVKLILPAFKLTYGNYLCVKEFRDSTLMGFTNVDNSYLFALVKSAFTALRRRREW